jgi:hypothetical protein
MYAEEVDRLYALLSEAQASARAEEQEFDRLQQELLAIREERLRSDRAAEEWVAALAAISGATPAYCEDAEISKRRHASALNRHAVTAELFQLSADRMRQVMLQQSAETPPPPPPSEPPLVATDAPSTSRRFRARVELAVQCCEDLRVETTAAAAHAAPACQQHFRPIPRRTTFTSR